VATSTAAVEAVRRASLGFESKKAKNVYVDRSIADKKREEILAVP